MLQTYANLGPGVPRTVIILSLFATSGNQMYRGMCRVLRLIDSLFDALQSPGSTGVSFDGQQPEHALVDPPRCSRATSRSRSS
jgi:hypothetical protein